jgi:hypothetical protein
MCRKWPFSSYRRSFSKLRKFWANFGRFLLIDVELRDKDHIGYIKYRILPKVIQCSRCLLVDGITLGIMIHLEKNGEKIDQKRLISVDIFVMK